jgi:Protein of unknown function (DUF992)
MWTRREVLSVLILAAACTCFPVSGRAAAAVHIGTLTCTLGPSDRVHALAAKAKLSCHFDATAGTDTDFTGAVKRLGVRQDRSSKFVLVWSVYTQSNDFASADLQGQYVGSLDAKVAPFVPGRAGLVGGRGKTITLKPLTREPNIP